MKEPRLYRIVRPLLTFVFKFIFRPTITGIENIPMDEGVVLAGNHTNNLDPILMISSTKRTVRFLAKNSLVKGWKKIIFANMAVIPVDRTKKTNQEVMEFAINALNLKQLIGVYPEGTINRTEDVTMPFKTGAVRMCAVTGATLVPFVISHKYKKFKKSVRIDFLESYKVTGDIEEENQKLQNIVAQGIIRRQEEK